ncbi:MAG TPA: putative holin [Lelliottia sp.]
MGEPVSTATTTTLAITSVTFASLLADTPAGVYVGAFAGAVVYVLSSQELSRIAQVGYFVASFLIGILGAELTTAILNELVGKYLPDGIVIGTWLGATVAAAVGVCFLISLRKVNVQTILSRLLSGGGDGNAK